MNPPPTFQNFDPSTRVRTYFTEPPSPAKSWLKTKRWPAVGRRRLLRLS
jgi:hypothetical protein